MTTRDGIADFQNQGKSLRRSLAFPTPVPQRPTCYGSQHPPGMDLRSCRRFGGVGLARVIDAAGEPNRPPCSLLLQRQRAIARAFQGCD
jgi:hypothetical protein